MEYMSTAKDLAAPMRTIHPQYICVVAIMLLEQVEKGMKETAEKVMKKAG